MPRSKPAGKAGNTVLVIDDDAEACEIIRRFLEKDGFEVVTAASGEEGLRLAHQLQPAAITLDVMMPDMDGWSVLRALKADPVLHTIPVVMLTMVDDKTRGYSLGATDYLTKPVDRDQLAQCPGAILHPVRPARYCWWKMTCDTGDDGAHPGGSRLAGQSRPATAARRWIGWHRKSRS